MLLRGLGQTGGGIGEIWRALGSTRQDSGVLGVAWLHTPLELRPLQPSKGPRDLASRSLPNSGASITGTST